MRSRKVFFTHFNNSPVFSKNDLRNLADKLGMPSATLDSHISRAISQKDIISLKRNFYVTRDFFDRYGGRTDYRFYLANALLEPSYVSLESALQYHGLLTESIENYYTSITTDLTRNFNNRLGVFNYRSIKENLFSGYDVVSFDLGDLSLQFLIANRSKAVFDYLYYRVGAQTIDENSLFEFLEEYRIDEEKLSKTDIKTIFKLMNQRR